MLEVIGASKLYCPPAGMDRNAMTDIEDVNKHSSLCGRYPIDIAQREVISFWSNHQWRSWSPITAATRSSAWVFPNCRYRRASAGRLGALGDRRWPGVG